MSTVISMIAFVSELFAWVYGILVLGDTHPDLIFMFFVLFGMVLMGVALLIDSRQRKERERQRWLRQRRAR